ncbi:hypothetical protein BMS3Bbin12_01922 [bacterium BMS3Bbin12]|nr:hypothetical protein BMS3Bbin12_01922 [bacterium BMS3Bbin12]GBE50971.1 hypothetical protein BMS3Bbin13_01924 [bacterium BMS3Bbin13]
MSLNAAPAIRTLTPTPEPGELSTGFAGPDTPPPAGDAGGDALGADDVLGGDDVLGAGVTDTATERATLPELPLHVSVKTLSALSGPTPSLPLTAFAPLHPPEAVHRLTFPPLHVSRTPLPETTVPLSTPKLKLATGAGGPEVAVGARAEGSL